MPSIIADGVTIHYRDEGRGPPVILLHAFPLHGGMFDAQVAALGGKYRFIRPDHRGFGQSGLGAGATEMSRLARDALALADALDLPRPVVGGVSMGGYATLAFLREAPGRARALLLLDTQMGADDDAGRANREQLARATEARGMAPVVEAFLPRLLAPNAAEPLRAEVRTMMEANRPEGAAAALRGLALRADGRELLAQFTGPALVACGEHDPITGPEKAKAMAELLRRGRLEVIPRAGHLANMENPVDFNRVLDEFLTDVTGEA